MLHFDVHSLDGCVSAFSACDLILWLGEMLHHRIIYEWYKYRIIVHVCVVNTNYLLVVY